RSDIVGQILNHSKWLFGLDLPSSGVALPRMNEF
ncbi:MAG: hypothetical protein ACI814_003561, partial [Mariniblastus sp.]